MKNPTLKWKLALLGSSALATCALVFTAALVTPIQEAQACRDCPFPMKVGESRWLMPNGQVEVELSEVEQPGRLVELGVTLRNAATGEIVATGSIKHRKGKKSVIVPLQDQSGGTVMASIQYEDPRRERVRIGLTCTECAISNLIN